MITSSGSLPSAALSWARHLLSQHPQVLAPTRDEVDRVLQATPPPASHLRQRPCLERVIRETLRLYPPIHVANRLAARGLEFQGHGIPAGTRVRSRRAHQMATDP